MFQQMYMPPLELNPDYAYMGEYQDFLADVMQDIEGDFYPAPAWYEVVELPEDIEGENIYYPPPSFNWQKWVIICVIIPLLALGVFLA